MHVAVVFRVLGILLTLFSGTMLVPFLVALLYDDGAQYAFLTAFAITLCTGLACWLPVRNRIVDMGIRDGFLITVSFWLVLGLYGALPLMIADEPHLSPVDAVFESLSGLTTTGATVIQGLDNLPESILFYRQQLQWLGGMGIIVLALAVLPMLGVGGMQLFRAETSGPVKDSKITPRIAETAKALWYIYMGLTVACAMAYWLAGMDAFDAIAHSFSTVSIGGFSTHDASIGFFDNFAIELIAVFFIVVSGISFTLHFYFLRRPTPRSYLDNIECRTYLSILLVVSLVAWFVLYIQGDYGLAGALRYGLFATVSIATTTGFATTDYSVWASFLPFLLFFCSFAGGCAGSTGGGIKVIRLILILKQGHLEIKRLIHPNAVIPIKINDQPVPDRVMEAVWGFFSVYVLVFSLIFVAVLATGLDLLTAFSAVAACINNLGPGLGQVALHYGDINQLSKWILCFAMLIGRLEIFTLLVLFSPTFWRN